MSGVSAERLLTGCFLDGGSDGDVRIARIGLGLTDGGDVDDTTRQLLLSLIFTAQENVLRLRSSIDSVQTLLMSAGQLDGLTVHEIVKTSD